MKKFITAVIKVSKQRLKNSSLQPLSHMMKTRSFSRKIWWMSILLIGISGSAYQITTFLLHYFKYPVVIDLKIENKRISDFPAVTVCNLNRMNKKYFRCIKDTSKFSYCASETGGGLGSGGPSISMSERRRSASCSKQFKGNKDPNSKDMADFLTKYMKLTYQERKFSGYDLQHFIPYCFFDEKSCEEEYFTYFQSLQYGNCFTFNKWKNNSNIFNVPITGKSTELQMVLEFDSYNYLDITPSIGARVIIHDPNENPNFEENGVNVNPGFQTSIKVKQVHYKRLKSPYPDECIDYKTNIDFPGQNQRECIQICIQELNLVNCTCIDPTISILDDKRLCNMSNATDACCLDEVIDNIALNGLPCKCPPSCLITKYENILSVSRWPAPKYECDFYPYCYVHSEMALIKVHFSTFEHITFEQNPEYQDSELYSNVGSLMSLWLGLSLLIIFEITEILIQISTFYYRKNK